MPDFDPSLKNDKDDHSAILNDLLGTTTDHYANLLHALPTVARVPSRKKTFKEKSRSSNNLFNMKTIKASTKSKSSKQLLSTATLAAGAHAQSAPNFKMAKDLYAEKLRTMRLERELSSSRVALRRSQQKEKDLRRSAVRKRQQHSKSIWTLLHKAARQTQRNPPLALAHSVPNLLMERDPVEMLRRVDQSVVEKSVDGEVSTGVDHQTYEPSKGYKERKQRKKKLNLSTVPLSTNVILQSPSYMSLRRMGLTDIGSGASNNNATGPKRKKKMGWETEMIKDVPDVPLPLPMYEELVTERPKIIPRTREMSYGVGGDGPWHSNYPGSKTLQLMKSGKTDDKEEDDDMLQIKEDPFLSTIGSMQTIDEGKVSSNEKLEKIWLSGGTGINGDKDGEEVEGDVVELDSSNMMFPGEEGGKRSKKTWVQTQHRNQPLLQDPYDQFAHEVKIAARKRRRLIMEILGAMEYQFDQFELIQRKKLNENGSNSSDSRSNDLSFFSNIPLTSIRISRPALEKMMKEWRLGDSINVKNTIDRLCHRVCTTHQGQPFIDGRLLLSSMRKISGNNFSEAKQIYTLKQSIKKKLPIMMQPASILPGSKLDRRKKYEIPTQNYPVKDRSRNRWDNDEFDATSMYIVPILGRPE
jgi:hypothetical protein